MTPQERREAEIQDLRNNWVKLRDLGFELRDACDWKDIALDKYRSDFPPDVPGNSSGYKKLEALHTERIVKIESRMNDIWQGLQKDYGITPGNMKEFYQAQDARKAQSPDRSVSTRAERDAAKLAQQQAAQEKEFPYQPDQSPVKASPTPSAPAQSSVQPEPAPTAQPSQAPAQGAPSPTPKTDSATRQPNIDYEASFSRAAARHAEALKAINQGVQQLKADMDQPPQPGSGRMLDIRAKLAEASTQDYESQFKRPAKSHGAGQAHTQEGQDTTHHDRPYRNPPSGPDH